MDPESALGMALGSIIAAPAVPYGALPTLDPACLSTCGFLAGQWLWARANIDRPESTLHKEPNMSLSKAILAVFIFFTSLQLVAGGTLVVPEKIAFGKETMVPPKVRTECQLEEKIQSFLIEYSKTHGTYDTITTEKPSSGEYHVLEAEIIEVVGPGGGAWSGTKSVKIKGSLKDQDGKVLGTFTAGRYSGGGAFGGYKGTCAILGRCTKAIGKDVAAWLTNPREGDALGDH